MDADKKVTIHFSTVEGQTSGYFYVPVPTGSLGNLSLVILNGQEEVATGAWDNITISRKDIKRATLGNQSIIGGNGEIKKVAFVSNVDAALYTTEDDLTVQVSGEVTGTNNTITIPAALETNTTTFSFSSVADGAKITIVNKRCAIHKCMACITFCPDEFNCRQQTALKRYYRIFRRF